jgi:hypothetical protein
LSWPTLGQTCVGPQPLITGQAFLAILQRKDNIQECKESKISLNFKNKILNSKYTVIFIPIFQTSLTLQLELGMYTFSYRTKICCKLESTSHLQDAENKIYILICRFNKKLPGTFEV